MMSPLKSPPCYFRSCSNIQSPIELSLFASKPVSPLVVPISVNSSNASPVMFGHSLALSLPYSLHPFHQYVIQILLTGRYLSSECPFSSFPLPWPSSKHLSVMHHLDHYHCLRLVFLLFVIMHRSPWHSSDLRTHQLLSHASFLLSLHSLLEMLTLQLSVLLAPSDQSGASLFYCARFYYGHLG